MPNIDITRDATEPQKHYALVQMQQGRVLTDDDFNEAERLAAEDARRERADVIGPAGSPDAGFKLKVLGGQLALGAGSYYVGGLRLDLEADEPVGQQKDWLGQDPLVAPANPRADFYWLDVWQQAVTAVEDKELFEAALGGADTSARVRTMRRARALQNVGNADCADAWTQLLASLAQQGTMDGDFELVPDVTLTVGPDGTTNSDDLCSPQVAGGYLGAENQAIRVQLVSNNQFTWGFDNGSPLYRVKLQQDNNGVLRQIHMLTVPKDQAHYPLEGQVVELLPWGALLPNGQKVAELSGFLTKVSGGYDPDTQNLLITVPPPANFGQPAFNNAPHEPAPEDTYYMRVWNRGADTQSAERIPFVAGNAVPLARTGLAVTFHGTQFRANDFWIIAARPETPNTFVPWSLGTIAGRRPHGLRRWIAPLGVVQWPGGGNPPAADGIEDCRPTFLPLTRVKGCCTYTVGDGTHSWGNFGRIQDALNALPPAGGEVCVLAGTYRENVRVERRNVKIHGCGPRSRVEAPAAPPLAQPVFTITNSRAVTLDHLAVIARDAAPGVLVERRPVSVDIHLSHLHVEAARRSGIEVQDGIGITIDNCDVEMQDLFSAYPAIFFVAKEGLIERNTLVCRRGNESVDRARFGFGLNSWLTAHDARGGLQLGGSCEVVRVRDNLIAGGIGHGITLGSFRAENAGAGEPDNPWLIGIDSDCEGCDPGGVIVVDPRGGGGDGRPRFLSAGPLREIVIQQNRIYQMGLCGIGVAGFFDLEESEELITVEQLEIRHNDIRFNLTRPLADVPPNLIDISALGGISLADVVNLEIDDNLIADNGRKTGGDAVCGIFVVHVEGAAISRNRIVNNGPRAEGGVQPKPGRRGGINIVHAIAPATALIPTREGFSVQSGVPAARIHDNVVVAPIGQALSLGALGPVSVEGNAFTTRGVVRGLDSPSFLGSTVFILNLGLTTEISSLATFAQVKSGGAASSIGAVDQPAGVQSTGRAEISLFRSLADGNVLFTDNQVVLDLLGPDDRGVQAGADPLNILGGLEVSPILIATLDDVGFADNQCDCLLGRNADGSLDFVLAHAVLAGWSVRMADNRMKEGIVNAALSAVTFGLMNATTNNQGTHCFLVYGFPGWKVNEGNRVLLRPVTPQTCAVRCLDESAAPAHNCTVKCVTPDVCEAFVDRHSKQTGFFGARAV